MLSLMKSCMDCTVDWTHSLLTSWRPFVEPEAHITEHSLRLVLVAGTQPAFKILEIVASLASNHPVLKNEFGPQHAGFGSVWSPQKARKFRHTQPTT